MGRLLTRMEVERRVRLSRSSLYRKVRDGTFPSPIHTGERKRVWQEDEIEAWLATRPRSAAA